MRRLAELVRSYEPYIRRAVRIRLADQGLRRVLDSMDIAQSVFGSFFVRAALGQYDLDEPRQLVRLLVDMGRKKLADQGRHERAARRDHRRIKPGGLEGANVPASDPTPSRQVAGQELLEAVRKRLSDDERSLAEQRTQGRGWNQIAADRGDNPEALRKRLGRAVDRAVQELGLDDL
jgi:RNA polymerase sigma-70 factor (ECF subfamily)